jgi:hypothetical protein
VSLEANNQLDESREKMIMRVLNRGFCDDVQMAIYIKVCLTEYAGNDPVSILSDGLEIAGIANQDFQVVANDYQRCVIELVCEQKVMNFYMAWNHIAKYLKKMYRYDIADLDMDDTERA